MEENHLLYTMKIVEGKWMAPQLASFTKNIHVERPVFSPDGKYFFFTKRGDIYWVRIEAILKL
jgi:hypothetical protein